MIIQIGNRLVGSVPLDGVDGWYQLTIDGALVPWLEFCSEKAALNHGEKLVNRGYSNDTL